MDATSTSDPVAPEAPAPKISATKARLQRLLERYGQSELARLTGIPQPRLSRWKDGVPVAADDALKLLEFEALLADAPEGGQSADVKGK
jgi:hypothetical protein